VQSAGRIFDRHDRRDGFRFAPLQSEFAQSLLNRHNLDSADFNTVVVLADFQRPSERAFTPRRQRYGASAG